MERRGVIPSDIFSNFSDLPFDDRFLLPVRPLRALRSPSDSEVLEAMESRDLWVFNFRVEPGRRLLSACLAPLTDGLALLAKEEPNKKRPNFLAGAIGE